jgi:hypothetical protein
LDRFDRAAVDSAVANAVAFLRERLRSGAYGLACIGNDGRPRFSDGKGHVFVASFIVEAMHDLFDEIDRTLVVVRMLSEEDSGLWGYSPPGPYDDERFRMFYVDSDDTAYVIRALRRLGVLRRPEPLLRFYRERERLFTTFDVPGAPALTTQRSVRNNMLAHPEVNANVFLALRGTHLEHLVDDRVLRDAQDARGFWPSYHYPSPLFGTLLALDVLRDAPGAEAAVARALDYVASTQNEDGSWGDGGDPHETALAVAALAGCSSYATAVEGGVRYLLGTLSAAGSWSSGACVWEFVAGEEDVWRAYDAHGAYVTARCVTALRRAADGVAP